MPHPAWSGRRVVCAIDGVSFEKKGQTMRTDKRETRTRTVPLEHLFGAHQQRREPEGAHPPDEPTWAEPVGSGVDVAPTRRAEERERARHHLQRAEGLTPAGDDSPRQRRAPKATRERLDAAARAADESIIRHPPRQ